MLDTIEHPDNVRELRLARPPVNALDPTLIRAILEGVRTAGDERSAVILSGRPGMFTAGLDVPTLLTLDREAMESVWRDFIALMRSLASSPVPVIGALTGHSPAGGAVLAVFCDYRVMAAGEYAIGLNEIAVGLPVPAFIVEAFVRLVGSARGERLLSEAAMLAPEQALAVGLVDEVVDVDAVVERALKRARMLATFPPTALRMTREVARRDLMRHFEVDDAGFAEQMADVWFSEETQGAMRALVARLAEKR